MGQVKAGGQGYRHSYGRSACTFDKSLTDGVEDNETGITEDRNGNDPSHQFNGQDRILFADQADDHVRQLQGGAGLLQDAADQGAQNDYDTDGCEGSGEALADDSGQTRNSRSVFRDLVNDRNTGGNAQYQRNEHDGDERMDLKFRNHHDHHYNSENEK